MRYVLHKVKRFLLDLKQNCVVRFVAKRGKGTARCQTPQIVSTNAFSAALQQASRRKMRS